MHAFAHTSADISILNPDSLNSVPDPVILLNSAPDPGTLLNPDPGIFRFRIQAFFLDPDPDPDFVDKNLN